MNVLMLKLVVDDIEASIPFYTALFGCEPAHIEKECAEWAVENPRIDVALMRVAGSQPGLASLGLHYDDASSQAAAWARLVAAGRAATGSTVVDPAGLLWSGLAGAPAAPDQGDATLSPFVRHRRELRQHFYQPTTRPEGRM